MLMISMSHQILLNELKKYNPELLDKHRILAVTKSDLLDEELRSEMVPLLPKELPHVFISSVSQQGLDVLKDELWKALISNNR